MIKLLRLLAIFIIFTPFITVASAGEVFFTKPEPNSTAKSPVEFCMGINGLTLEPASKGVNEGAGHHHLLVRGSLPKMIKSPLRKGRIDIIHLGDGSECYSIELKPGKHKVRALFANGAHVPFYPPVTSTIKITVE